MSNLNFKCQQKVRIQNFSYVQIHVSSICTLSSAQL